MAAGLESIKQSLRNEEAALKKRADELRSVLKDVELELQSVLKALAALDGRTTERKKPSGMSPSRDDVAAAIKEIRDKNAGASKEELRALVEGRLKESGYNLLGFKLRYDEVMAVSGPDSNARAKDGNVFKKS